MAADLLRLKKANDKCKRFVGSYDDLPIEWDDRSKDRQPMFSKNPPPFLTDSETEDYKSEHSKLVSALNIENPSRSQKDKASRSRLELWGYWFESRSRWESSAQPEPDFTYNDGLRGYFDGSLTSISAGVGALSIAATMDSQVAYDTGVGVSAYRANGMDAEDLEDGFASAEMDDFDDLDDLPSDILDFKDSEDEGELGGEDMPMAGEDGEEVDGEEMPVVGAETGYETGLTIEEGEEHYETMSEARIDSEDEIDVYKIKFTPINGPINSFEWTPCCW